MEATVVGNMMQIRIGIPTTYLSTFSFLAVATIVVITNSKGHGLSLCCVSQLAVISHRSVCAPMVEQMTFFRSVAAIRLAGAAGQASDNIAGSSSKSMFDVKTSGACQRPSFNIACAKA